MINYDDLPQQQEFEQPKQTELIDEDYGFTDAFTEGLSLTFPFVGTVKHPILTDKFKATEEEIKTFYKEEYPTLSELQKSSLDNNGGFKNRQQADAIIARAKDEEEAQRRLYEYGGLGGSIGIQIGASLFNPVDWAVAVGTFGTGKYLTTMKAINKAMNNYKKSSSIALGAAEGAAAGYLSETIRQETQSIYNEDDRFNTLIFGSVLGGTLGAKGWFDFVSTMNPQQQQKLFNAMDVDDKAFADEVLSSYKSVGSAGVYDVSPKLDVDDLDEVPTPAVSVFGKYFSPRSYLYTIKSPTLRKVVEKLAPSVDALKTKDGQFVVQSQTTAYDYKHKFDGAKGELSNKLADINTKLNKERVEAGMPKLSEEEFGIELHRARLEGTRQIREHEAEIEVLEELARKKDASPEIKAELEALKSMEFTPTYSSNYVKEINDAYDNYYKLMEDELYRPRVAKRISELQSKPELSETEALELSNLQGWQPSKYKGYVTRIYNKDLIKKDLDVVRTIERALQNSPTAKAIIKYKTKDEVNKYMDEMKAIAINMSQKIQEAKDLNALRDIAPTKGSSSSQELVAGGFTTARRVDVDEEILGDLVQRNMFEVTDFYHQDMAGKLAIRKAFKDDEIDTWEDFREKYATGLSEEFNLGGMDQATKDKTLENLEVVYKDLRGIDQIAKNSNNFWQRLKRGLMTFNNIRFAPNFGLVSLNELGPTIQMGSVKTLSYMMPSIKAAVNKINSKEAGVEFINELQAMGIGIDLQHSKVIERYTEGQHFFETNSVLNTLRKAENKVFRWSQLPLVTDVFKSMLSAGFTMRLVNMSKRIGNLSYREQALLSRIGLSEEDLVRLSKQPIKYDDNGHLEAFNLKEWDEDLSDKMGDILHRVTKGNILEPTSMDLPRLMTDPDKPLNHLLTQYYRFPIAAQYNLLSKAVNDRDVGALLSMMVSGLVSTSVEAAKVYAAVKIGELAGVEVENPYDDILNDEEQQFKLATKMAAQNPMFGVAPMAINVGAALGGYNIPGTNYTPNSVTQTVSGPSLANLESIAAATRDLIQEPGTFTDNQRRAVYQQLPRVLGLFDLSKHYIKGE